MDDFFRTGKDYDDAEPYKAPELTRIFRCEWVCNHPETGEPVAFGFMRVHQDGSQWVGTGMGQGHWDQHTWRPRG
jgi:hypothetical protein